MKRTRTVLLMLGCAALGVALSSWALADIEGSKHDFSAQGGDLCGACHVPHRAQAPTAPLWDPEADTARRFIAVEGDGPGLGTRLCLTCHDGTVAADASRGTRRLRLVGEDYPQKFATGHQTTDHPVGVPYPKVDKGYRPLTAVVAGGAITLPEGRVECRSCHDPHNEAGEPFMLVLSNVRSALCLACHKK